MMKRMLIATDVRFWEEAQGSHMRMSAIYRYLRRLGLDVQIMFTTRLTPKDEACIAGNFPEMILHCRPELMDAARKEAAARQQDSLLKRILRKAGLLSKPGIAPEKRLEDFTSTAHQRYFRELCETLQPDFVMIHFIRLAYLIDGLAEDNRPYTFIDTEDVMHLRAERYHAAGERHWINISREEEAALMRKFDGIIAIQPRDADTLQSMAPAVKVITAMHPTEPVWHAPRSEKPVTLFYLATKGLPHQKAIARFFDKVWPNLLERFGNDVKLRLGGSICDIYNEDPPPGTELPGFIDDLNAAYETADIVINPVIFGGGLKIKCVEALSHSKPLVTTPVGAEGLEDGAGSAFLLTEDDAMFGEYLAALIEDPAYRRQFAEAAFAYARNHFAEDIAFAGLRDALFPESEKQADAAEDQPS